MKHRVEKDLTGLQSKMNELKEGKSPFKVYINKIVPMLDDFVGYYKRAEGHTKKRYLVASFRKKSL